MDAQRVDWPCWACGSVQRGPFMSLLSISKCAASLTAMLSMENEPWSYHASGHQPRPFLSARAAARRLNWPAWPEVMLRSAQHSWRRLQHALHVDVAEGRASLPVRSGNCGPQWSSSSSRRCSERPPGDPSHPPLPAVEVQRQARQRLYAAWNSPPGIGTLVVHGAFHHRGGGTQVRNVSAARFKCPALAICVEDRPAGMGAIQHGRHKHVDHVSSPPAPRRTLFSSWHASWTLVITTKVAHACTYGALPRRKCERAFSTNAAAEPDPQHRRSRCSACNWSERSSAACNAKHHRLTIQHGRSEALHVNADALH